MKLADLAKEIQTLKGLRHERLIRLHAVCSGGEPVYIVTELMRKGNLQAFLGSESLPAATWPHVRPPLPFRAELNLPGFRGEPGLSTGSRWPRLQIPSLSGLQPTEGWGQVWARPEPCGSRAGAGGVRSHLGHQPWSDGMWTQPSLWLFSAPVFIRGLGWLPGHRGEYSTLPLSHLGLPAALAGHAILIMS